MGIRCWKFTDGETVSAKLVRDLWKMEFKFKDMETTLRDIKSTWQWKWQGNWEVLREWTAKLLEVEDGFGKENQRMKNHANYFEKTLAKLIKRQ